MSIEARLERLEKQMQFYKRLVVVLALVIVAGVSMGQSSSDIVDVLKCKKLEVYDEYSSTNNIRVSIENGAIKTHAIILGKPGNRTAINPNFILFEDEAKDFYTLITAGHVGVQKGDEVAAMMGINVIGGVVSVSRTWDVNDSHTEVVLDIKEDEGGRIRVWNKTDEEVINLHPDVYGNGRIGVWNRKGEGRVYDSQ